MSLVNGRGDGGVIHVAAVAGSLFDRIRASFAAEEWNGLRQSHFRLLSSVPRDGCTVTELAQELGMSKQACGQFVTFLTGTGHLRTAVDPADRRLRRVHRTTAGDRLVESVDAHLAAVERDWADQVGSRRYATFRAVMWEIATSDKS